MGRWIVVLMLLIPGGLFSDMAAGKEVAG